MLFFFPLSFRNSLRFCYRHVVSRMYHLRVVHGEDNVLRKVEQSDVEIFHGSQRENTEQSN